MGGGSTTATPKYEFAKITNDPSTINLPTVLAVAWPREHSGFCIVGGFLSKSAGDCLVTNVLISHAAGSFPHSLSRMWHCCCDLLTRKKRK